MLIFVFQQLLRVLQPVHDVVSVLFLIATMGRRCDAARSIWVAGAGPVARFTSLSRVNSRGRCASRVSWCGAHSLMRPRRRLLVRRGLQWDSLQCRDSPVAQRAASSAVTVKLRVVLAFLDTRATFGNAGRRVGRQQGNGCPLFTVGHVGRFSRSCRVYVISKLR